MEAESPFEKLVPIYQTTWRLKPRDQNLNTHRSENLVSKIHDDVEIHSVVSECTSVHLHTIECVYILL
jgi:hypothetical protein